MILQAISKVDALVQHLHKNAEDQNKTLRAIKAQELFKFPHSPHPDTVPMCKVKSWNKIRKERTPRSRALPRKGTHHLFHVHKHFSNLKYGVLEKKKKIIITIRLHKKTLTRRKNLFHLFGPMEMNTMLLQMPPVMDNSIYDSYGFITAATLHPSYLRQLCHVFSLWYL